MAENESPTLESTLLKVFESIREKLEFRAPALQHPEESVLEHLIQAATSKCLEFNLAANSDENHAPSFLFISNLRGICEDLICLAYLTRLEQKRANKLIWLKIRHDYMRGLQAQRRFFRANNPAQHVLASSPEPSEEEREVKESKREVRENWPSIRKLTEKLKLEFTYDFIYFATSNFVHFNPNSLFRTGWGSESGPFSFSIRNMDPYYRRFGSLYGAILFIGFHAAFEVDYFSCSVESDIDRLIEIIGAVPRWPEIITLEEMNKPYKFNPLVYAVVKRMRERSQGPANEGILKEILSLKAAIRPVATR